MGIGNKTSWSDNPPQDWLREYQVQQETKKDENGQAKLMTTQLEVFVEEPGIRNVLVVGSITGIEKGGMSYPEIAKVLEGRNSGTMTLVDLHEDTTKSEKVGDYLLKRIPQSLRSVKEIVNMVDQTRSDIIIYDKYDEKGKYVDEQLNLVRAIPHKTFLLKIPNWKKAIEFRTNLRRIGVDTNMRIFSQLFYDKEEVRAVVSPRALEMSYTVYTGITCSTYAEHGCMTCKRIQLLGLRLNVDPQRIYDAVIRMGVYPCKATDSQRMMRILAIATQYYKFRRDVSAYGLREMCKSYDIVLSEEQLLTIQRYMQVRYDCDVKENRKLVRKAPLITMAQEAPSDYKALLERYVHLSKGIMIRPAPGTMIQEDHWAYKGVSDAYRKSVDLYKSSVRTISFPIGTGDYTQMDMDIIVAAYIRGGIFGIRNIIIRARLDGVYHVPRNFYLVEKRESVEGYVTYWYQWGIDLVYKDITISVGKYYIVGSVVSEEKYKYIYNDSHYNIIIHKLSKWGEYLGTSDSERVSMYGPSDKDLMFMACLIAVVGWAVIEGVLWVLRHLSWVWN